MPLFPIKAAAKLSGISEHTLRAWEKRYAAVTPQRTDTGRRLYSQQDVARLRILGVLTDEGHTISGIATLDLPALEALLRIGGTARPAPTSSDERRAGALSNASRTTANLRYALEHFQLDALSQGLTHAKANFGTRAFVLEIVSPLMHEVGKLVAENQLSISQEHMFSALLRDHLGPFYQSLRMQGPVTATAPRMAFCVREGDLHEFGILLAAILAAARGAHTEFLGPNLPAAEAARAAQVLHCTHLVVGSVPLPENTSAVPLERYLVDLDGLLQPEIALWIGGIKDPVATLPSGRHLRALVTLAEFDGVLAGAA